MRRQVRPAFTLVELAGVLVLSALLAGGVSLTVSSSRHRVEFEEAIQQIIHADAQVRDAARRFGKPGILQLDLATGRLRRQDANESATVSSTILVELPGRVRIEQVRMGSERTSVGEVRLAFSSMGLSPSYALLLKGVGGRHQWVAVMGLTGQPSRISDDEVEPMFESISGTWADAH